MKRKFTNVIITLFTLTLLSSCNINQGNILREANQSEMIDSARLTAEEIREYNYGEVAYKYLEYIQESLPGRIAFTEKEHETAVFILSALLDMGYTSDSIQVQQFSTNKNSAPLQDIDSEKAFDGGQNIDKSQNIIVTKKGESEKVIIVAAHYDSVGSHGVDDNGSGMSIVLENALRIIDEQTPYTTKYIFFGSEEVSMTGSRTYVESLSKKEKQEILLMINIDSVLAGDTCYLYGGTIQSDGTVANDWAVMQAYEAAQALDLDISLPPKDNIDYPFPTGQKRSDHAPFSDNGIPYIYFEANNWNKGYPNETEKLGMIMHTANDDLDIINSTFPNRAQETLSTYSVLLEYIIKNFE